VVVTHSRIDIPRLAQVMMAKYGIDGAQNTSETLWPVTFGLRTKHSWMLGLVPSDTPLVSFQRDLASFRFVG
jgi:hypothetical protein